MSALSPPRGAQSPGPASVPGTTQWRVPHREPGEWGLQPPPLVPVCAGSLVRRSVAFSLERHLLWTRSHTVFWGQQCRWSEQQMACVGVGGGLCDFLSQLSAGSSQVTADTASIPH